MESTDATPGFFARLKQHHIYRVAVGYGTAIAVLIQVVARAFPYFGWAAAVPAVIIILIAGFPVAIVLAWLLVKPADPASQTLWQKRHWKLGAVVTPVVIALVVVSGIYAFRFSERHAQQVAAEQATPIFNPPADSLVVLPFANLSDDPKQQYFSDGITEELTDALGQNTGLRVIAWDTAAKLRDSTQSAGDIGKALDVANLLHGSIQREGDAVRITAELVDTRTGLQLWSQHYDDSFANLFKVQDQVSAAIARALKVKFAQAELPAGGTGNPEAHERVLQGRALTEHFTAASFTAAQKDFEQAIALDPGYADAHALLSRMLLSLTQRSDLPLKATLPRIRAEAEKALALDPRNTDGWLALGNADASTDPPDFARARADFQKALALDPSNANAHLDYGTALPLNEALAETKEATLLDPANETAWNNLAVYALDLGDWEQEIEAFEALIKLDPTVVDSAFGLAFAYQQLHQYERMVAAFNLVKPATPLDREQVEAGRLTYRALTDPALRPQALAALKALARHQSNQDVASNLLQMYLALGEPLPALALLESSCPAYPVGCSDLAINPVYRALHGNPRFEALAKKYTTVTLE
ncbi:MAG: tetratricopeptide repeat protein [Gammaproteobacteria bacterium]